MESKISNLGREISSLINRFFRFSHIFIRFKIYDQLNLIDRAFWIFHLWKSMIQHVDTNFVSLGYIKTY